MGFFSWNCKECGHPLLSTYSISDNNAWMMKAVVLKENGSVLIGNYGGYGDIDGMEMGDFNPCVYHHACWVKAGKPEYSGPSEHAADQGYFFDDGDHDMEEPHADE